MNSAGQNKQRDITLTCGRRMCGIRSYTIQCKSSLQYSRAASNWLALFLPIDMKPTTDLGCTGLSSCFEYGTESIRTHEFIMTLFHTTQNVQGCTIFEWKYLGASIARQINLHSSRTRSLRLVAKELRIVSTTNANYDWQ